MNMLKNVKLFTGLFIILFVINSVHAEVDAQNEQDNEQPEVLESAKNIVLVFQEQLLNVMKQGKQLGFQGRYKKLESAIVNSHDLSKIVRIVVGKQWKNLSEEQKIELTDVFNRLSISSYAHNFTEFSGESFEFISEDKTARGGAIIRTAFIIPTDKDVTFDYMLKKKGDNWRIINIIANGVSDLALKRSEYTSILKRDGFEALIAKIKEKNDNYAKN